MGRCVKCVEFVVHACGAPDGRPLFGCRRCGGRWTSGHYDGAEPGGERRLLMLATYDRFRMREGLRGNSLSPTRYRGVEVYRGAA